MLIPIVKATAKRLVPKTYQRLRNRYHREARLTRAIVRQQGYVVATGPFAGMRYIDRSHGSRLVPKLLGSYESELHEVIAGVMARPPAVVVDVGCAEGYYAVGFARALRGTRVYAYDIDPDSREMCRKLAGLNGIAENLVIRGKCDCAELESLPLTDALVLSDCEGYELELLRPDRVPQLKNARLLVELHEFCAPGLTAELLHRFRDTHAAQLVDIKNRDASAYVALRTLTPAMRALALYERDTDTEPQQQWAYLEPREDVK